jgi:phosphoadenosine phosphosulfate reductase
VVFIDTFHLFDETLDFLKEMERHYGFKAHVYRAEGT